MRRREFISGLAGIAAAWRAAAYAQQKIPRIGIVVSGAPAAFAVRVDALRSGLRELGYVEGRNIALEYRYASGDLSRLPKLFAELVAAHADVIVTHGVFAALQAKRATTTVPIVIANVGDAVAAGLVASLARPGGNITGSTVLFTEITGKSFDLLQETFPLAREIAVLANPDNAFHRMALSEITRLAQGSGLEIHVVEARVAGDLAGSFAAAKDARASALVVLDDQLYVSKQALVAKLALESGLPTFFSQPENVEAGGFLSYGARLADSWHRAAYFIDKILKGVSPADIPVEQPTKFELVINLKTAKALGLTVPLSLLARADEVIE